MPWYVVTDRSGRPTPHTTWVVVSVVHSRRVRVGRSRLGRLLRAWTLRRLLDISHALDFPRSVRAARCRLSSGAA